MGDKQSKESDVNSASRRIKQKINIFRKESTLSNSNSLDAFDLNSLSRITNLKKHDIKLLYKDFMTRNPSGNLDKEAFRKLYSKMRNENPERLKQISDFIFTAFDQDLNGLISFREFLIGFTLTSRGDHKDKLIYAFDLYDTDKSGTIDFYEMKTVISAIMTLLGGEIDASYINNLAEECMVYLDKNGDGIVSRDEFIEGLLQHPHLRKFLSPF